MKNKGFSLVSVIVSIALLSVLSMTLGQMLSSANSGWQRVDKKSAQNEIKNYIALQGAGDLLRFLYMNRKNPLVDDCVPTKIGQNAAGSICTGSKNIDSTHKALLADRVVDTPYLFETEIYGVEGIPLAGTISQPILLQNNGTPCSNLRTVSEIDLNNGTTGQHNYYGNHEGNDRKIASHVQCPLRVVGYMALEKMTYTASPQDPGNIKFFVIVDENPKALENGLKVRPSVSEVRIPASLRTQPSCPAGTSLIGFESNGTLKCQSVVQAGTCGPGTVMTGINPNGTLKCDAPPAQTVTTQVKTGAIIENYAGGPPGYYGYVDRSVDVGFVPSAVYCSTKSNNTAFMCEVLGISGSVVTFRFRCPGLPAACMYNTLNHSYIAIK